MDRAAGSNVRWEKGGDSYCQRSARQMQRFRRSVSTTSEITSHPSLGTRSCEQKAYLGEWISILVAIRGWLRDNRRLGFRLFSLMTLQGRQPHLAIFGTCQPLLQ